MYIDKPAELHLFAEALEEIVEVMGDREDEEVLLAVDTETTGLDWKANEIVGASVFHEEAAPTFWFADAKYTEAAAQLGEGDFTSFKESYNRALGEIWSVLESPATAKVFHNSKFDLHFLSKHGCEVKGKIYDTFILARLLDETRRDRGLNYKLKDLAVEFFDPKAADTAEKLNQWLEQNGLSKGEMYKAPREILAPYAAEDVRITMGLYHVLRAKLRELGVPDSLVDLECEMLRCAYEMEKEGLHIDKAFLTEYAARLAGELKPLLAEMVALAGQEFNPSSDAESRKIALALGWVPKAGLRTTDSGVSMDKTTLASWDHPFFKTLATWRRLAKLSSTFVVGLLEKCVDSPTGPRVHTEFNTAGADTYRWSSSKPNVQNQDKKGEGRKGFIPKPGHAFWFFDFKQIEPVIATHFTESEKLFKAFADGLDFHTFNAQMAFNVAKPEDVTKEQRAAMKVGGLAIMYGAGKPKIARTLGVTYAESSRIVNTFGKNIPEIKHLQSELKDTLLARAQEAARKAGRLEPKLGTWLYDGKPIMHKFVNKEDTSANCEFEPGKKPEDPSAWWGPFESWEVMKECGYLINPFGRRLQLPMKYSYDALNKLVQSTAGDCLKIGMARAVKATGVYPINQVHDELIFQFPLNAGIEPAKKVKAAMESVGEYFPRVPIRVDVAMSETNWAEEKEVVL